jgi:hypothetical protein
MKLLTTEDFPPGAAGQIAEYIYQAAPRPVPEVAIVGALGLLAGICGRQWQISSTGLNCYLILVARSGIGKEALHTGISNLINAVTRIEPRAASFVTFNEMASGPALTKATAATPCLVNLAGEVGHKFAAMANAKPGDPMASLRRVMTTLYMKSSAGSITGGLTYSDQERNIEAVGAVSYSMIGDTTPGTLYEAINGGILADGFMSRFTIVPYDGDRPVKNEALVTEPPALLIKNLAGLATHARDLEARCTTTPVTADALAQALLLDYEMECDLLVRRAGDDEAKRQLYNRAHLKVLRIAALLAVADNSLFPVIAVHHAEWAIGLITRDISTFTTRIDNGDIGEGDDARESKLLAIVQDYLTTSELPAMAKSFARLREKGIVPRKYLQQRTQKVSVFSSHTHGAARAMDLALASLVSNGHLADVPKKEVVEEYGYHGKCFRVLNLDGEFRLTQNWMEAFVAKAQPR